MKTVFIDTGPLVAFFNQRDQYHHWAQEQVDELNLFFTTCEAVLVETLYLTKNSPKVLNALKGMIGDNLLKIDSPLMESPDTIFELFNKYHDISTSLADVSLLSLYNQKKNENTRIFTIDSDFLVYRDSNGEPLKLISPHSY